MKDSAVYERGDFMAQTNVLVVDDEKEIADLVEIHMSSNTTHGYTFCLFSFLQII